MVRLGARVGQSPLHMVSAWSVGIHLTLGQVATHAKSNEITAIPELLKVLDLQGAIRLCCACTGSVGLLEQGPAPPL